MPGIVLYPIVGMNLSVASGISFVQSSNWVSISSNVGLINVGKSWLAKCLTYPSQSAFLNCRRGLMGIVIGLHDIVAIMGMWSEDVIGPGCSRQLWNFWLLAIAMSADVVLLCCINVEKSGPNRLQRS